jgi:lycopene cyclase domain-containing protein
MYEKYLYLLVDVLCIFFPLAFSFHPKINFYKQWRYFLGPNIVTAVIFIVWDIAFTRMGVWSFNPRYVSGLFIAGLPIEEYLFFLCIPYASVFTYYCLGSFFNFNKGHQTSIIVSWSLILLLLATALGHLPQLYTSVTFISLAVFIGWQLMRKVSFLPAFYISYMLILLPFFASNGVLTGIATPEPVVSYNNNYNLGIRLFTIPVEDVFYGMLLLLMNVTGFEYARKRNRA